MMDVQMFLPSPKAVSSRPERASQRSLTLCETRTHCPFDLKVRRAIRLVGLSFERRRGPGDCCAIGKGPTLVIDGVVAVNADAIMRRLNALVPGVLVPKEVAAEAWLFEQVADRCLSPFVFAARWLDPANWDAVREAHFGDASWFTRSFELPRLRARIAGQLAGVDTSDDALRRALDALEERAPDRGFWLGTPRATLADVAIFAQLASLRSPLTPRVGRELSLRPALSDWLDRVDAATC